jgi:hypothetical protein
MDDVQRDLVRATAETLRPFVERLLKIGVPFGVLQLSLRELFVRVAESKLGQQSGKRLTDSQIALVTGINRKEVKRIRATRTTRRAPRSFSINQATSLISRWMNDRETTDARGRPIPLPYQAGRGPSFMKIARKLTGDLAPGVLLDELVRSGAVEIRKDGLVVLRGNAYVPKVAEGGLTILAEDPAELAETILRNVFAEGPERLLQRKIFYDNLGGTAANRIRAEMRREGERFLRRIDRLLSRYDRDRNRKAPPGERMYAALGVYFFESSYEAKRELLENNSGSKVGTRRKRK